MPSRQPPWPSHTTALHVLLMRATCAVPTYIPLVMTRWVGAQPAALDAAGKTERVVGAATRNRSRPSTILAVMAGRRRDTVLTRWAGTAAHSGMNDVCCRVAFALEGVAIALGLACIIVAFDLGRNPTIQGRLGIAFVDVFSHTAGNTKRVVGAAARNWSRSVTVLAVMAGRRRDAVLT